MHSQKEPIELSRGTVFVKTNASMPESFRFGFEEYRSWRELVDAKGPAFEKAIHEVKWHFFYLPPDVERSALARSRQSAVNTALDRIFDAFEKLPVNALEISAIATRRIFQLYSVHIAVSPRHLQPTPFFCTINPQHVFHGEQYFGEIFRRAASVNRQHKGI